MPGRSARLPGELRRYEVVYAGTLRRVVVMHGELRVFRMAPGGGA